MRHPFDLRAPLASSTFCPALWALGLILFLSTTRWAGAADQGVEAFRQQIRPILVEYCFDCHADGANKGNVAFDELKSDHDILDNHDLWLKALKTLRAGLMPPPKKPQPSP